MSVLYPIQVTLPVLKALTAELQEGQTFDDLLRHRLGLESTRESDNEPSRPFTEDAVQRVLRAYSGEGGFFSRGLSLPNGTELRAHYKGREHRARIANNSWLDERGKRQSSPSAAATAITGTNVNGLRFWEAKRPDDSVWRRLDALVHQ